MLTLRYKAHLSNRKLYNTSKHLETQLIAVCNLRITLPNVIFLVTVSEAFTTNIIVSILLTIFLFSSLMQTAHYKIILHRRKQKILQKQEGSTVHKNTFHVLICTAVIRDNVRAVTIVI